MAPPPGSSERIALVRASERIEELERHLVDRYAGAEHRTVQLDALARGEKLVRLDTEQLSAELHDLVCAARREADGVRALAEQVAGMQQQPQEPEPAPKDDLRAQLAAARADAERAQAEAERARAEATQAQAEAERAKANAAALGEQLELERRSARELREEVAFHKSQVVKLRSVAPVEAPAMSPQGAVRRRFSTMSAGMLPNQHPTLQFRIKKSTAVAPLLGGELGGLGSLSVTEVSVAEAAEET